MLWHGWFAVPSAVLFGHSTIEGIVTNHPLCFSVLIANHKFRWYQESLALFIRYRGWRGRAITLNLLRDKAAPAHLESGAHTECPWSLLKTHKESKILLLKAQITTIYWALLEFWEDFLVSQTGIVNLTIRVWCRSESGAYSVDAYRYFSLPPPSFSFRDHQPLCVVA